jgi:hypothetical protein
MSGTDSNGCLLLMPSTSRDACVWNSSNRGKSLSCRWRLQVVGRISKLADGGFNTYVTDAQRGYTVILVAGPLAALVFCLVYMLAMRFFAGIVAWSVVVLINLLFIAMTMLAAYKSELLGAIPGMEKVNNLMGGTGATLDGVISIL